MKHNTGLLAVAVVAVIAVLGLVILFNGSATGAVMCGPHETAVFVSQDATGQRGYNDRSWECVPNSRSHAKPSLAQLQAGHASEYTGSPSYTDLMQRRKAFQGWEANSGQTYEPHQDQYVNNWAPNRGESYQKEPSRYQELYVNRGQSYEPHQDQFVDYEPNRGQTYTPEEDRFIEYEPNRGQSYTPEEERILDEWYPNMGQHKTE